ncbi:MAG: nitroreductase family protein [Acidimicrobiales bacterium]
MQLDEIVRRRRMVRSYSDRPVPADVLDRVLGVALRGPSAGFSQGVDLLVLEGAQTEQLFELTSDPEFIAKPGPLSGLLRAPVIVLPLSDPAAYVARYSEADKAGSSLAGVPAEGWPVPYWLVDSSFAVMLLLLAATDEGLGALFFRLHRDPGPFLAALDVPEGKQVVGAVALGYEAPAGPVLVNPPGSPARRARRPSSEVVHRGRW